jgi:hypothetical protein
VSDGCAAVPRLSLPVPVGSSRRACDQVGNNEFAGDSLTEFMRKSARRPGSSGEAASSLVAFQERSAAALVISAIVVAIAGLPGVPATSSASGSVIATASSVWYSFFTVVPCPFGSLVGPIPTSWQVSGGGPPPQSSTTTGTTSCGEPDTLCRSPSAVPLAVICREGCRLPGSVATGSWHRSPRVLQPGATIQGDGTQAPTEVTSRPQP